MTDLISRADAIEAVKSTKPIVRSTERNWGKMIAEQHSKELVKALKALPSAETHEIRTETHGVCLISKDDAMGAVQDHFNANGFKGYDDGQKMMDRIKALPSAEAVQGEWQIIGYDKDYVPIQYTCSVCGSKFLDEYDFCPDCGARMKGGAE